MSDAIGPWARLACDELAAALEGVAAGDVRALADEIGRAGRIALHGVGREGLMMRALAMRLFHLGLDAHPVGDMTTPSLGPGDLLVASAGPGHFATVGAYMGVARAAGARVALLTARPDAALAAQADTVLVIPARTMARPAGETAVLPMGSAYEGAMYLLFEHLVGLLREAGGISEAAMRARHTNLE